MLDFFSKKWSDTFRSFLYMERSKNIEKIYHNHAKKSTYVRGFDRKNTGFGISKNLIRNVYFEMTLNARKTCADSFLKIKSNDNRAGFSRSQQSSEKFESKISYL